MIKVCPANVYRTIGGKGPFVRLTEGPLTITGSKMNFRSEVNHYQKEEVQSIQIKVVSLTFFFHFTEHKHNIVLYRKKQSYTVVYLIMYKLY